MGGRRIRTAAEFRELSSVSLEEADGLSTEFVLSTGPVPSFHRPFTVLSLPFTVLSPSFRCLSLSVRRLSPRFGCRSWSATSGPARLPRPTQPSSEAPPLPCVSTASVAMALPFLADPRQEHCICLVFPLRSWLRQRISVWSSTGHCRSYWASTAFLLPRRCPYLAVLLRYGQRLLAVDGVEVDGKPLSNIMASVRHLPLPCVTTAFVAQS